MIEVKELSDHRDLAEAVRVQRIIWGFEEVDLLPQRLFVVATKIGGHAAGAFDGDRMVGFSLAIPGLKADGGTYWHSHMMGVLEDYRDRGVGRMLKMRQRTDALARGIRLIEWTFDPLELKNAYFNIERLGVVVRRYVLNQYGSTSSPLHGSLPTDRCVAEWHLDKERPSLPVRSRIEVPAEIAKLRRIDASRARAIQENVSSRFVDCLRQGLAVVGFERLPSAGAYLLAPWPSE